MKTEQPFYLDRHALKAAEWTVWLKLAALTAYGGVWGAIYWLMI